MTSRLYTGLRFIVLLAMALKTMAASLLPLVLTDSLGNQPVAPPLEMFADPSGKLALKDVLSARYADKFVAAKTARPELGYTRSAWWMRFNVRRETDAKWLLMVDSSGETSITLYAVPLQIGENKMLPLITQRLDGHLYPLYAPNLAKNQSYAVYLRLANYYAPLSFNITLATEGQVAAETQYRQLLFGFTTGGILSLAVYNLFLFFSFRENSYLSLVGFFIALMQEAGHQLLPLIISQDIYLQLRPIPSMLAIVFGLHFFRQLIQTEQSVPLLDKVFVGFIWAAIGFIGVLPFISFTALVPNIMVVVLLPLVVFATALAVQRGYRIARSFIWAVFVLFLATMPTILGGLLVLKSATYAPYFMNFGFLGFMLLLSLTQVERLQELREKNERVQAANTAKTNFLNTMSHELRTPMNAVIGISGLMRMSPLNAEQKNYLNKLETSSRHMLRLIDNILDFSKIEQLEFKIAQKPFKLDVVLNDIKNILYAQANQKGLRFVCHHRYFGNETIVGDDTRLAQVLLNLAGNALKFTEHGRVDVFIRDVKSSTDKSLTFYFEIRDTGIGISAAQLQQLFQPFSQADSGTKKRYGGSGLGLVISQRLVRAMGGELQVETVLNEGSRFFFTLSFARWVNNSDEQLAIYPILAQIRPIIPNTHILLVDDDDINRFVARRFLEARHIGVTLASNGQEALAVLDNPKTPPFAMVFMDVSMPEMDGYEATRKIRAMGYTHLPIIALTAHAITGERERCVAAGMNDFFTKPFELHELEQIVRKWA
jgi:signal transduction histidine kinase/CheY-like chemotaxis protein